MISALVRTPRGIGYALPDQDPERDNRQHTVKPGQGTCFICGRGVKMADSTKWIELFDGGGLVSRQAHEEDTPTDPEDSGYMGCFPVGPRCARVFPTDALFEAPWMSSAEHYGTTIGDPFN